MIKSIYLNISQKRRQISEFLTKFCKLYTNLVENTDRYLDKVVMKDDSEDKDKVFKRLIKEENSSMNSNDSNMFVEDDQDSDCCLRMSTRHSACKISSKVKYKFITSKSNEILYSSKY